jgi:hypothetical protein
MPSAQPSGPGNVPEPSQSIGKPYRTLDKGRVSEDGHRPALREGTAFPALLPLRVYASRSPKAFRI